MRPKENIRTISIDQTGFRTLRLRLLRMGVGRMTTEGR